MFILWVYIICKWAIFQSYVFQKSSIKHVGFTGFNSRIWGELASNRGVNQLVMGG